MMGGDEDGLSGLKWEKYFPTVDTRPPAPPASADDTTEKRSSDEDNLDRRRGRAVRREERRASSTVNEHYNHTKTIIDDETTDGPVQYIMRNEVVEPPDPSFTLPRGEAQGGHYPANTKNTHGNDKDCFIFYGGMHHHHSLTESTLQATTILGDVWRYDYDSEVLRILSPYPPPPWQVSVFFSFPSNHSVFLFMCTPF